MLKVALILRSVLAPAAAKACGHAGNCGRQGRWARQARRADNPAVATFIFACPPQTSRVRRRKTWHVEFDLTESSLDYTVRRFPSVCFPVNDPGLVEAVPQDPSMRRPTSLLRAAR